MAELADALDLGSSAQKACRFKSCSRHQPHPDHVIPNPHAAGGFAASHEFAGEQDRITA